MSEEWRDREECSETKRKTESASLYNSEGEELQTNKKKRRGRNFLGKCYSVTTVLQVLSPFLPWLACLTAVWVVHMHYLITYSLLTTCYPFLLSFFLRLLYSQWIWNSTHLSFFSLFRLHTEAAITVASSASMGPKSSFHL